MPALQALKELTSELSSATNVREIGEALVAVSQRFGFTTALILDMTKLFDRVGPALIYATSERKEVESFDLKVPFANHPFTLQARLSEKPFVMSRLRLRRGESEEAWQKMMPDVLRDKDGVVVPVHEKNALAWAAAFAGADADLSQRALSVLSAAVHAGHARFVELWEEGVPKSPLSPREAECLRWIAHGKTDFEVGKILEISPRTVRFHINNAKNKLGVATRIQAVAKRASGAMD